DQLQSREGYDPQKESANFGPLWRGGEWHLRDITNHMTTAAFFLLKHAAQNREHWLQRFYEIEKQAVRPREQGELSAYIIAANGRSSHALVNVLLRGGVEVKYPMSPKAEGVELPPISALVLMQQPYGSFAKALLEAQQYPDLRDKSGRPIAPYDVTAHTLP